MKARWKASVEADLRSSQEQVWTSLNKFEQECLFKRRPTRPFAPNVIEQFMRQKKKLPEVSNGTKFASNAVRIIL
jgi:hypothetical protein